MLDTSNHSLIETTIFNHSSKPHSRLWLSRRSIIGFVLIAPTVLTMLLLTMLPLFYMFYISFFRWSLLPTIPREFVALSNFTFAFSDPSFIKALQVSGLYTLVVVFMEVILGFALAYSLSEAFPFLRHIRGLFIIPMMIAPVVAGLVWRLMLNADIGLANFLLSLVSVEKINWLGDPVMALISVMLVDIWEWTPFTTLIILAGLESLPLEIFEAARVDGANRFKQLQLITIPLIAPVIGTAALFRSFDAFQTFDTIYVLTRGGPGNATLMVSYQIWIQGFFTSQLGYASALSLLVIVILSIFALVLMRLLKTNQGE
jgi:multiple sugar transport system permease protein